MCVRRYPRKPKPAGILAPQKQVLSLLWVERAEAIRCLRIMAIPAVRSKHSTATKVARSRSSASPTARVLCLPHTKLKLDNVFWLHEVLSEGTSSADLLRRQGKQSSAVPRGAHQVEHGRRCPHEMPPRRFGRDSFTLPTKIPGHSRRKVLLSFLGGGYGYRCPVHRHPCASNHLSTSLFFTTHIIPWFFPLPLVFFAYLSKTFQLLEKLV
ncbi:unnamed protein product [Scytosiphon promiscuus]